MYHSAQYRIDNGSATRGDQQTLSTIQVIKPRMEIISIGEKTEKANVTYVVAKQTEMRLTHDKANIKVFTHYESDANNSIVDAENIGDDKTNNTGDQGWYTNNMYYSRPNLFNSSTGIYTVMLQQYFYKIQIIQILLEEHIVVRGFNGNFLKKLKYQN